MLINWLLGDVKTSKRSGVIWNSAGGMFNAGQAAIILIFISYKLGLTVAGIVTIAYAVANLFLSICKYGVRNYQVTDVKDRFSFGDYFYSRCFTTVITFGLLLLYLAFVFVVRGYSLSKIIIFFEITTLKLIDAFEDVYIGRYQQKGRLDIGAKIMAIRLMVSTGLICVLILAGMGIYASLLGGILSSVILDIYFIRNTFQIAQTSLSHMHTRRIAHLLKICLPLCIGMTLSIYIGNVPKYMIDAYMGEDVQAIFGYIMMPVFVITLLNQFIYQPMIKRLGDLWESGQLQEFKRNVVKQCMIVIGLTAVVIAAGLLLGLPVLSVLYNVELSAYRMEFAVLLLGGGFYALAYYLNVPITTIRMQNYIAYGYALATVLSVIFGRQVVLSMGMMGAAILYLGINAFLIIAYILVLAIGISKRRVHQDE